MSMIGGIMTDREMAAELGRLIIQLQQRGRALEAVLTECCPEGEHDPVVDSWHHRVKLAQQDAYSQQVSAAERRDMLQNIGAETDDFALIRVLHNQFLRTGPRGGNVLEQD